MGLCASLTAGTVLAQIASDQATEQTSADKKKTQEFEAITVTGSLIPKSQIENISPQCREQTMNIGQITRL